MGGREGASGREGGGRARGMGGGFISYSVHVHIIILY